MNKKVCTFTAGILISAILLLLTSITLAQYGDALSTLLETGYDLSWWTVDGGGSSVGATGSPGLYTLDGTIGQPDAALWQDETYTLVGGFWGGAMVENRIYLPLILKTMS